MGFLIVATGHEHSIVADERTHKVSVALECWWCYHVMRMVSLVDTIVLVSHKKLHLFHFGLVSGVVF